EAGMRPTDTVEKNLCDGTVEPRVQGNPDPRAFQRLEDPTRSGNLAGAGVVMIVADRARDEVVVNGSNLCLGKVPAARSIDEPRHRDRFWQPHDSIDLITSRLYACGGEGALDARKDRVGVVHRCARNIEDEKCNGHGTAPSLGNLVRPDLRPAPR